jgi:hypothetical protein
MPSCEGIGHEQPALEDCQAIWAACVLTNILFWTFFPGSPPVHITHLWPAYTTLYKVITTLYEKVIHPEIATKCENYSLQLMSGPPPRVAHCLTQDSIGNEFPQANARKEGPKVIFAGDLKWWLPKRLLAGRNVLFGR